MPKKARVLKKLEVDKIKNEGLHAVGVITNDDEYRIGMGFRCFLTKLKIGIQCA